MRFIFSIQVLVLFWACQPGTVLAVTVNQVDDFQNGTTQAWTTGLPDPNPPTNVADGGPGGSGDGFLKMVSTGSFGAGSRLVAFNKIQWTGNYISIGARAILAYVNNLGATNLNLRVAFLGANGTRFISRTPFSLQAGSGWTEAAFSILEADLVRTAGSGTYSATMGNIAELRINSSASPNHRGDSIAATLGVDKITLLGTPFRRGNVTPDTEVNLSDVISTLEALFLNGGPIACSDAADSNDDGAVDMGDVIFTLFALFQIDSVVIPDPGTLECGTDPTGDGLGCEILQSCQ